MNIKLFVLFNLFIFLDDIMKFSIDFIRLDRSENKDKQDEEIKLYNIPLSKILSLIFKTWKMSNKDFLNEIVCDNIKYWKIANLLEEKGVLVRWQNNSRILNKDISIEQAIELLTRDTIHKERDGYYSYNPTT